MSPVRPATPADGRRPLGLVPVSTGLALLALVFNAFTWGLSWWPMRQLQTLGLHPLWVTALGFGVVTLGLALRHPAAVACVLRERGLWAIALAAGLTNAGFNWAVTIGDVVRVVLLFYLMPVWTLGLAWWLLGERPGTGTALRVALALLGAALVLMPPAGSLTHDGPAAGAAALARAPTLLADALAVMGGMAFACNNVMLRRQAAQPAAARALAMFAGGGGVALVLAVSAGLLASAAGGTGAPSGGAITAAAATASLVPWPPALALPWVAGTAALALWMMASNLALQYGAARLPANTTSVVMLSEVAFAGLSSVALGAAQLDGRTLLGAGLILAAALLAARSR